jgi:hypothetical protein
MRSFFSVIPAIVFLSMAHAEGAPSAPATVVTDKDFDYTSRYLAGENWAIFKYKSEDSWNAIFKGDMGYGHEGIEYEFGHGHSREDTFGFYLWPDAGAPTHLLVYRWTGGSMGAVLNVLDLEQRFRHVLQDETFDFSSIEDLNDDGAPELIGVSRAFYPMRFVIDVSHADTPYPPLILSPGKGGHFRCVNAQYPDFFADKAEKLQSAYEKTKGETPIPAEVIVSQRSDKFLALLRWAVFTYYTKGQREAEAIMDAHLDPILAAVTKHAVYWEIQSDPFFPKELTKHYQDHPEDYQPIEQPQ